MKKIFGVVIPLLMMSIVLVVSHRELGEARAVQPRAPQVKVVSLPIGDQQYVQLLGGPPETVSMRSGLVTLPPGRSIGQHSTENDEEMLVPLEGQGELHIAGRPPIPIKQGVVTYTPPNTTHDVVNTSTSILKYIFIVAKAQ